MSLLLKNALIVNADKMSKDSQDILIEKEKIAKISPVIKDFNGKTIDCKGKLVLPGFIDLHAHLREPGREDEETIETGSRAAVKGGFTTICAMPNTNPVIDNAMIVEAILKEAKRVGLANILPVGAVTKGQKGEELVDMFELKEAGCIALSDDGYSVNNAQLLRLALEYSKMTNQLIMEHCQDQHLFRKGAMNEGFVSTVLGLKGDPVISETVIVARDIEIANYLGVRIHFSHISAKRSVELIRMAKKQGIKVTAEATPHHFSLTEEEMRYFNTNAKVNPSLRSKEDVEAIREGLKDGTLDCIATDHAPHAQEEKEQDLDHAPYGIIGLETALALAVTELIGNKVLTWPQLARKMSKAPSEILNLKEKGEIKEGLDADLVIIDPQGEWEVKADNFASKSRNSPLIGRRLKGEVKNTVFGGKIVF
ncbi:MAG: dihydroorotase [Candidatus Omnitrophica bacterium]|nr:dihydroorotase [Candidatus Omnitrophota bacterium]